MKIAGKTVFITGGAGGIATAFARALLQNDAQVILADINEDSGKKLAGDLNKEFGSGKVFFIKCDVTDESCFKDTFQEAVSKFQRIDVMVNNAGIFHEGCYEKMITVNLNGVIRGTNLGFEHMRKDAGGNGGVIINVASILGLVPHYGVPVYSATKHAVTAFTRSMATAPDLDKYGIRYACICPDAVDTEMTKLQPKHVIERYYGDIMESLKTAGKLRPDKVAEALISLLEDDDSNNRLLHVSTKDGLVKMKINVEPE